MRFSREISLNVATRCRRGLRESRNVDHDDHYATRPVIVIIVLPVDRETQGYRLFAPRSLT